MDKYRNTLKKPEKDPKPNEQLQQRLKIPISPDRELLLWEKWIVIRKDEIKKLGHTINRQPTDLAMNLLKYRREDIERKTALEHAQIEKKVSCGYGLFEQPLRLKQRCKCECNCDCEAVYEIQRTHAELGRPRVIQHIGVPKHIQVTELGISGTSQRKDCSVLNAEYIKYRQTREEDLAERLKKIDPFRPATSELLVKGFKPKPPPPKIPRGPNINVEAPKSPSCEYIETVYAVKINRSVWFKNIPGQHLDHLATYQKQSWHEDCTSWTYYFNVPINKIGRGKLFLENLGTVALRYYWKSVRRQLPCISYQTEHMFFFNQNEDVLSPGQSKYICFTFVSNKPGLFYEYWELIFTNICFFETVNEKINIELCGDATQDDESIKNQVKLLKVEIKNQSLDLIASEILNEVLNKIFVVVPQIYPYKKYFLEAQIFVMKNPVCFYHQTEVEKMKDMFGKELVPGMNWDLSIATWRKEMMTKQYDDRMRLFSALKTSHADLLKPWYEGDSLLSDKYFAVNTLMAKLANRMDADYARLTEIYSPSPRLQSESKPTTTSQSSMDKDIIISNIFYVHTYQNLVYTIEQCAGILSSLDSNRWIEFDFCRA